MENKKINYAHAADVLERIGNMFSGITEAAAVLKEMGGVKNAADEMTASLAVLSEQVATQTAELDRIKFTRDRMMAEAKDAVSNAQQLAARTVDQAKNSAADIRKGAQETADVILKQASDDAAKIVNDAKDQDQHMANVRATVAAEAQAEITKRDSAIAELADLNAKISAARAQIATMLSGA